MKCILVPVDGSSISMRAVKHAIQLARSNRATVHLLNVEPELDTYGMAGAYVTKEKHRKAMFERAKDLMAPAVESLSRARVRSHTHVLYGHVAKAIVRTARRLKCDSIVMGTRGMGAIGGLLLGSVATKVIHLSPVPVTLVR